MIKISMLTYDEILDKIQPFIYGGLLSAQKLKELEMMVLEFSRTNPRELAKIRELNNQIDVLKVILASLPPPSTPSSFDKISGSLFAKSSKSPSFDEIIRKFDHLWEQEITTTEIEELQSLLERFRGTDDQRTAIQKQFDQITDIYLSQIESSDSSPLIAGAGSSSSESSPSVSTPKTTKYADFFDELSSQVREYQSLKTKDIHRMSEDQQIEWQIRLSELEMNALKVIEGEPGRAIASCNTEPPILNNPAYAARVRAQLQDKKFPATRQVRGDGNCYYRSVIYAYLEQSICADPDSGRKLELVGRLKEKIENLLGLFGNDYDHDLRLLIKKLGVIEGNPDYSLINLQEDMLDNTSSPSFDHLLVRAARALTAKGAIDDAAEISPFFDEHGFDEYVMTTLSMKQDADGILIEKNYLGKTLGINIDLLNIAENGTTSQLDTSRITGEPLFNIHLLRDDTSRGRRGAGEDSGVAHYFITYDPKQKKNIDEQLEKTSFTPRRAH